MLEDWLLNEPPDRLRLVLASRRDIPLALVTLELTGAVTVFRADSLRFSDVEARALVTMHAPDVTSEDADAVRNRAQGWAAALVLGARTLSGARDRARAREALAQTEQPVLDYLLNEVFATLPASTRHVLLCTADSESVTDASAVILSGDPEAPSRLAYLSADGLLVTTFRTDPAADHEWHYHPLLHEALRRQVALDGPDHALAIAAHGRAALHHAAHGPVLDAIRHATRAELPELLASLLVAEGPGLVVTGHEDVVVDALTALPSRLNDEIPALVGVAALAHRSLGEIETAAMLATQTVRAAATVRRRLGSLPGADLAGLAGLAEVATDAEVALLADAAILENWQARFGWTDAASAVRRAREVLGCHQDETLASAAAGVTHESHQSPWPVVASRVPWLLNELAATELWTSQFSLAETHTGEALVAAEALGQHRTAAAAYANRALIEMFYGRTETALATSASSLAAAEHVGRTKDSYLARAHVVMAWVAFSQLEYERSREALAQRAAHLVARLRPARPDPVVDPAGPDGGRRRRRARGPPPGVHGTTGPGRATHVPGPDLAALPGAVGVAGRGRPVGAEACGGHACRRLGRRRDPGHGDPHRRRRRRRRGGPAAG